MYIDSRKFNYDKFSYDNSEKLVERDKEFLREGYKTWMEKSVSDIVERQWEIDDIGAVEQVGPFVRLLKEAEFTYSVGAYISTIALVGVCAEDLCRFFSSSAGYSMDSDSQFKRVDKLLKIGAISQSIADEFTVIRRLRNDCLHYNDGFKQKGTDEIKANALNAINSIKSIYSKIIGAVDYGNINTDVFINMIKTIAGESVGSEPGSLGLENAITRTRNIFSEAFGIDLSMNNGGAHVYKTSIFMVDDVDPHSSPIEIAMTDKMSGMTVIVDLSDSELSVIRLKSINPGDTILASIKSIPNGLGVTGAWTLWSEPRKLK